MKVPPWIFLSFRGKPGEEKVSGCELYSYRLIGKLTAFLQLQEFRLRLLPLDSFTSAVRCSPHLKTKLVNILGKSTTFNLNIFNDDVT
jgi:hypothetical protein